MVVGLVAAATTTAAAAAALPTEAIAAVDGPVAARPERHGSLIAAFGADHRVHLAGTPVVTEAVRRPAGTPCLTARVAPLRFVRIAFFGMLRLIVRRKDERLSTLHAC